MSTQTKMTKKAIEAAGIEAGKADMRKWLDAAYASGKVYYSIDVSRSGMAALVKLYVIRDNELAIAWPTLDYGVLDAAGIAVNDYDSHKIARDAWRRYLGFDYERRGFKVGGCGFNRVQHVMDMLCQAVYGEPFDQRKVREHAL